MSFKRRLPEAQPRAARFAPHLSSEAYLPDGSSSRAATSISGIKRRPRGVRASPLDGCTVTSTGCASLDAIISGHTGLPLGASFLICETGTTDFASILLRYFISEGVEQGHDIWVGGGNAKQWFENLPAIAEPRRRVDTSTENSSARAAAQASNGERMKIAWRYNHLGEFGSGLRDGRQSGTEHENDNAGKDSDPIFCHDYDLTKRRNRSSLDPALLHDSPAPASTGDPFTPILASLVQMLDETAKERPKNVLRCVLPGLLSPTSYPTNAALPRYYIHFMSTLRALLKKNRARMVLLCSLSVDLYPRTTPSTRWSEILLDGSFTLRPFATSATGAVNELATTAEPTGNTPQGLLLIHKMPGFESSQAVVHNDLSFRATRKNFVIEAWTLGVLDEEQPREGGHQTIIEDGMQEARRTKIDVSF
ncbi:Elongator subunit elp4 [Savitreella phatthalungensis]